MKKRIISALIAIALVLPLILLGGLLFYVGVGIMALLAYKEIVELKKAHKTIPNFVIFLGMVSLSLLVLSNFNSFILSYGLSYQRIIICILLLLVPTIFYKDEKYTTRDAMYMIGFTFIIGIVFNLMILLRNRDLMEFLYVLLVPMVTDIFALLGGKYFGKNKLSPKISPKKTKEGAVIGFVFGTVVGVVFYSLLVNKFSLMVILVTMLMSIMGQIGDLIMSKIKRENEIKDFSNLMPGHGGILDRTDSIIFSIFTYLVLVFYL